MQKINSTSKKTNYLKSIWFWFLILWIGYFILLFFLNKDQKKINEIENITNSNVEEKNKICKWEICFDIEYAISPEQRQKWLMFRENLPEMSWMLFVFETIWAHKFWMKNTLIKLDMLRLDSDYKIIFIEKNVPPCEEILWEQNACPSYWPEENSSYVLEINWWLSEKYWIQVWDKLAKN